MFIGLSVIWLLTIGTQGESASFRPVSALWLCATVDGYVGYSYAQIP